MVGFTTGLDPWTNQIDTTEFVAKDLTNVSREIDEMEYQGRAVWFHGNGYDKPLLQTKMCAEVRAVMCS